MHRTALRTFYAFIASPAIVGSAHAADLTVVLSTPVTSLDPHFHKPHAQ